MFKMILKNISSNKKAVAVLILCLAHPEDVFSRSVSLSSSARVFVSRRPRLLRYVYPVRYVLPTIITTPGPVTNRPVTATTETSNASANEVGTESTASSTATSNVNATISSTFNFGAGSSIGAASIGNITSTVSPSNTATGASAQTTGAANNDLQNPTQSKNDNQSS